ncbi:hypothetical protein VSPL_08830 [Vibrio splendidus]|nr:hypothetical protein VSPL_08830 [Vibrio splendidus]
MLANIKKTAIATDNIQSISEMKANSKEQLCLPI